VPLMRVVAAPVCPVLLEGGAMMKEKRKKITCSAGEERVGETKSNTTESNYVAWELHVQLSIWVLGPQLAMLSCIGDASKPEVVHVRLADNLLGWTMVAVFVA
jgi:hypothetical protein